jgi:hypothetical protein
MSILPILARQQLGKNVNAATNTHATIEELLNKSFSMWSVSYQRRVCGSTCPLIVVRQRLGKHVPAAKRNSWRRRFLCGPLSIKKSRLFLPRISCSSLLFYLRHVVWEIFDLTDRQTDVRLIYIYIYIYIYIWLLKKEVKWVNLKYKRRTQYK